MRGRYALVQASAIMEVFTPKVILDLSWVKSR